MYFFYTLTTTSCLDLLYSSIILTLRCCKILARIKIEYFKVFTKEWVTQSRELAKSIPNLLISNILISITIEYLFSFFT